VPIIELAEAVMLKIHVTNHYAHLEPPNFEVGGVRSRFCSRSEKLSKLTLQIEPTVYSVFHGVRDAMGERKYCCHSRGMPVEDAESPISPASRPDEDVVSSGKEPKPRQTVVCQQACTWAHPITDLR